MMDRIEVTRRRAAELHLEAVALGNSPEDVYEFAKAEATRRGIEVAKVPLGDVRLCGGRAVFDSDAWLILHEQTGDPFMDAFLISHEIGHVEFGGEDEAFTAVEVDPTRASGSAGVGADRVIDYNRQQRREVQMDLFAREFLLPRTWMRRLHLEEGETAKSIANTIGAPKGAVVQQLLDAMLLPEASEKEEAEAKSQRQYNDQQLAAMRHPCNSGFLVKAGPGTGKTRTLIGRIEHLLSIGTAPESILVLTFSNKAAGELSERLAVANPDAAARLWVGTFHSFGLDILRRFHERLDLPDAPSLVDTSEAIAMLEAIYPRLRLRQLRNLQFPSRPIKQALDAISRAHDEVIDPQRYAELANAMLAGAVEEKAIVRAEQCVDVACMYAAFEEEKQRLGQLTFGDLVSKPVRLCEEDSEVREHLSGLYQHVLVDEFQDVNRASVRLLKALAPTGKNLWVVGDARQSIYRFRGASSYNLERFCGEDFPGSESDELNLNYRSVPEINAVVDQFASSMTGSAHRTDEIVSHRKGLEILPELRVVEKKTDEVRAITESIAEMAKQGYAYRDNTILCTGNARLAEVASELESCGIPVLFLGNLFERDEIRDLLSLVSMLNDGRAVGLLRLAATAEIQMSISDASAIIDALRESEAKALQWTEDRALPGVSEAGLRQFAKLREVMADCHPRTDPWQLLSAFLFDHTRIAAELANLPGVAARAKGVAIWQLMNFAKSLPPGKATPAKRLLDRIRDLVIHSDDRELRQLPTAADRIDAVRMMTMHGSKGLESPIVHVAGLTSASIPRSGAMQLAGTVSPPDGMIEGTTESGHEATRRGLEAEQECLFFVALSRAKDRLFLYRHQQQASGRKQAPSRFLALLGGTVKETCVQSQAAPDSGGAAAPTCVSIERPFRLTDHQISLYHKCPARFLYAHVLKTGGRRTETAYMLLHDAVQDVVSAFTSAESGLISLEVAESMLDQAMADRGFDEEEAAGEYRSIATELVRRLVERSAEGELIEVTPGEIELPGGSITVEPDQIIRMSGGHAVYRRIRTGHAPSKADKTLESSLLYRSAQSNGCAAQLLHLGDDDPISIERNLKAVQENAQVMDDISQALLSGHFPTRPTRNCPFCPAYFICGKLPSGEIVKKIPD